MTRKPDHEVHNESCEDDQIDTSDAAERSVDLLFALPAREPSRYPTK